MNESGEECILELREVVFDVSENHRPVDFSIRAGGLVYLPGFSRSLYLLGVKAPQGGQIRFRGRDWASRLLANAERSLRRIGTVVNPRSHAAKVWIGNLDVDENVHLASQFDPARTSTEIIDSAAVLASSFGLRQGLPTTRPAETDERELILSQWVRAFLPKPLDLLILENPLEFAPPESVPALVREIGKVRSNGTSVLWIAETIPPFATLGIEPELVLE